MKKVSLDKNMIAVGLYWANLSGEKPSAELSVMAGEVNRPYGFLRKVKKDDGGLSYQAALSSEKSLNGTISGAAAIAKHYEDIIFVEKISSKEVWICAVYDKEVLAGGDQVVHPDKMVEAFEETRSGFVEDPVFVYSSRIESFEGFSELPEADETMTFGELMDRVDVKKFARENSEFKISSVTSNKRELVLAGVAVAVILALGVVKFGGDIFGSKEPQVLEFPVVEDPIRPAIDATKQVKVKTDDQILAEARVQEVQWLREDFNSIDPTSVMKRIIAFDIVQDKFVAGWNASSIEYSEEKPGTISVVWKRDSSGTPLSLKNGLSNADRMSFSLSGESAKSDFDIIDRVNLGIDESYDILGFIDNNPYKFINMQHDLISMNYSWSMKAHNQGDRKLPIEGLKDKSVESQRQLSLVAKDVEISGSNRDQLTALIKIFDVAETFKLKSLTMSLEGEFQWRVEGVLYENQI